MLLYALAGHRLQHADAVTKDRVFQVGFRADHVADLTGTEVVDPLGHGVIAGPVGDHCHYGCGNVTVVGRWVWPGITVQFLAGPVPHLLRSGLPAEHDALLQRDDSGTVSSTTSASICASRPPRL